MSNDDEILKKHSVVIAGHQTSITLENIFWSKLKEIAHKDQKSLKELITEIDRSRTTNLSSAIRVYILKQATINH
ncbi:ribbon-helix-helix domain-containing protein [Emcibacteraceae bacterium]|jgi:predicted DNA-binding ribbon-helix-helix protein|uniref:ribbon-helix-helix domain-containing protein n=1 Tax=Pseudemcibacter sp. TaxID=2943293 RepID=UPI00232052D7|nr:ribbon-helix-helix domain-containing protein [Kordiimonadaceae bacterium]MDA7568680.1 ribbon-helix-helix domain-containing protein [Emcibacteraceae bacterium]MDA9770988.1 ribbon-helix-helix domain-containing protein [Emcibacteraceae bacterium]MDC1090384.1 ribbon-helix-helix domain-containing protein [Emcibacteraceae bacterium]MDG1021548.1 ribbon-helix-helix domain-containing protein [Emcibacteraceae bacterium]